MKPTLWFIALGCKQSISRQQVYKCLNLPDYCLANRSTTLAQVLIPDQVLTKGDVVVLLILSFETSDRLSL